MPDHSDAVIFVGSGSKAAINRMIDVLNLGLPADLDDRPQLRHSSVLAAEAAHRSAAQAKDASSISVKVGVVATLSS
jgi:hypothetical protein